MGVLLAVLLVVAVLVVGQRWRKVMCRPPPPPEPIKPHATFHGGDRYTTADERLRIEIDGPSACGEGVLMAIVDALRAKGLTTNPVEPESYGYMTVVTIDGEDVVLRIGSWGKEFEWTLYVESPSRRVPPEIVDALGSLGDIRDISWR